MFDTVLVANRGEIAVRILVTLRRMGIRSVAVYSDADAGARHVREADVALRLGPAAARESYLCIEAVLAAAAATGAQAVHPGYGFLAESAAFAAACAHAGVVFVGPPVSAVEMMGDKIRAKLAVMAAGVSVVPGCTESAMTDADLIAAAAEVGFPLLVKPSAGGGGKGMRVVHERAGLPEALVSARREAASSFGDDTLFLERLVVSPRHIEVQVLADGYGTTVHLGERECSLQRRHQKVIEEAPSVLLCASQRERIGAAAVEVARAADYTGVGTVEFLVPAARPEEFFFLEMNTRLQVEHAVTEQVVRVATGRLDLVEQQLRVAAGERLAFGQADIRLSGHAVEARVYAEDPARGFLPTGGPALLVREPVEHGVRIDSSLLEGARVGTDYDPLLSKVTAWGPDRVTALARLDRALAAQVLIGVGTNTVFLRTLLAHPDVRAGRLDTGLIERELEHLVEPAPPERAYQAYALVTLCATAAAARTDDPWAVIGGWRLSGSAQMSLSVAGPDGLPVHLAVSGQPAAAHVRIGAGEPVAASAVRLDDGLLLTVADRSFRVLSAVDDDTTWLWLDGATYAIAALAPRLRGTDAGAFGGEVRSPMPGAVIAVRAKPGDIVRKGDVLVVVEAMKMEHGLPAPSDGTVGPLAVRLGDQVALGQLVTTVTAAP